VIVAVRQNCSQSKNNKKSPPESGGHLKAQTNRLSGHRQHSCTRCSKTNRSDRRGAENLLSIKKTKKSPPESGGHIKQQS
jgi:type II secretory ATPase GspE/PulE/Tfp pilus assembly ATPase PilB-like protein